MRQTSRLETLQLAEGQQRRRVVMQPSIRAIIQKCNQIQRIKIRENETAAVREPHISLPFLSSILTPMAKRGLNDL